MIFKMENLVRLIFRNKAYLSLVFLDKGYNFESNKIKEGIVFHYIFTNLIYTNLKIYSALKLKNYVKLFDLKDNTRNTIDEK